MSLTLAWAHCTARSCRTSCLHSRLHTSSSVFTATTKYPQSRSKSPETDRNVAPQYLKYPTVNYSFLGMVSQTRGNTEEIWKKSKFMPRPRHKCMLQSVHTHNIQVHQVLQTFVPTFLKSHHHWRTVMTTRNILSVICSPLFTMRNYAHLFCTYHCTLWITNQWDI